MALTEKKIKAANSAEKRIILSMEEGFTCMFTRLG